MRSVIALCLMLPSLAIADAGGPDAFRVTGIKANDVLNMRIGPSVDYRIAGQLPPDARHLKWEICVPTLSDGQALAMSEQERAQIAALPRWCLVHRADGLRGWVNARFLTEDSAQ